MSRAPNERTIVFLIGAVQFINILDFMMVMPLGPDFAAELGIDASKLGIIGGAYTASASFAGLAGAFVLDRWDRRTALLATMAGLVLATALGGFAGGLGSLVLARLLAGAFGGPATSIALSIVTDVVPPARRGRAMGAVMGAFSVASVLGVPVGLELARLGGWRLPFFAVAGLGLPIVAYVSFAMPPLRGHLARTRQHGPALLVELLRRPIVTLSLSGSALMMAATFLIVPNISSFVQFNAGYPREHLGLLYSAGGLVSFFVMRLAGAMVDRLGAFRVAALGCGLIVVVTTLGFFFGRPLMPVLALFIAFMSAQSFRNVAFTTLASRVPRSHERASFQSLQSAVQHMACSVGAMLSAQLLYEGPGHRLEGMPLVAGLSIVLTAMLPWVVRAVARALAAQPLLTPAATPLTAVTTTSE